MVFHGGIVAGLCAFGTLVLSHETQAQESAAAGWSERHMLEQHGINAFTPSSFFKMHDFGGNGFWTGGTIRLMYGLDHESNSGLEESKKAEMVGTTLGMFDSNQDGQISEVEYLARIERGIALPDFGVGPGHHRIAERNPVKGQEAKQRRSAAGISNDILNQDCGPMSEQELQIRRESMARLLKRLGKTSGQVQSSRMGCGPAVMMAVKENKSGQPGMLPNPKV